jgi:hypothetical protein
LKKVTRVSKISNLRWFKKVAVRLSKREKKISPKKRLFRDKKSKKVLFGGKFLEHFFTQEISTFFKSARNCGLVPYGQPCKIIFASVYRTPFIETAFEKIIRRQ